MPDDTHIDLRERVLALEQMLVERTAERDAVPLQESAARLVHPPPRWGRDGVRVTDRPAAWVIPRTEAW
jgi:hypothetical protein